MKIKSKNIYTHKGKINGVIEIKNGIFEKISDEENNSFIDIDATDYYIIPGIVDTHNHGVMGYSLMGEDDNHEYNIRGYLKGLAHMELLPV